MPAMTRAAALSLSAVERIKQAIVSFLTGTNPDGSPFGLPVQIAGTDVSASSAELILKPIETSGGTLWLAPGNGKRIRLYGGLLIQTAAGVNTLNLGGVIFSVTFETDKPISIQFEGGLPLAENTAIEGDTLFTGGTIYGYLYGKEEEI